MIRGSKAERDLELRADVAVIGTGAGGAACAKELAELGLDVLAIEAGPPFSARDVDQREETTIPRLYVEGGRRGTVDHSLLIVQGRGVGGSTLHNTGLCIRAPAGVLERWRREHGVSFDLAPYMERVERHLGAKPIRDDEVNEANASLRRGAESLGWKWIVANHNRTECEGCGYCVLGCAYNRKNGMSVTYVPRAIAAGARILADARVHRIAPWIGGLRVWARFEDELGRPLARGAIVEARAVVVAAGAIDTPAILRASRLARAGDTLRIHPALPVAGIFARPVRAFRGVPQSILLTERAPFFETGRGGWIALPAFGQPAMTALMAPGLGPEHWEVMRAYDRMAVAGVLLHDETRGRVRASRLTGRPVISYWPDRDEQRELARGAFDLARVWFAAGAEAVLLPFARAPIVRSLAELDRLSPEAFPFAPHEVAISSVHPQGSVAMGDTGPVDQRGRLRGVDGVWVADASLFPTSVGVPPQITTAALATHVASEVARSLGKGGIS